MKMLLLFLLIIWGSCNILVAQTSSTETCIHSDSIISYFEVDELPQFQFCNYNSALDYIYSNIHYPYEIDVQGKVIVSFVITKSGKIEKVQIEKKLCNECDNEVQRVLLSMPLWSAGKKNGKAVNTQLLLVVNFKLK